MKHNISIPVEMAKIIRGHFFQSELEQGAFLFATTDVQQDRLFMAANDFYLVPSKGWAVQKEVYLEMKDSERAKIMKMARDRKSSVIDCHSHPNSLEDVWFSPSDRLGISEYAQYAKWKLDGRPFAAMVWGESSIDAVIWHGDFSAAIGVDRVDIGGTVAIPNGSWFNKPRGYHRFSDEY